jgi:hypothetical protein
VGSTPIPGTIPLFESGFFMPESLHPHRL